MTVTELDTLSLVPPPRFGRLLAERRWQRTATLESLAAGTAGRYGVRELAEVEAGRRPLHDDDVILLCDVYGVHAERAVHPRRTRLTVDVDLGSVEVGRQRRHLAHDDLVDDVLIRYLGLVVALRGAVPGTQIPLRQDDLDVLADTLWLDTAEIEGRLVLLMTNPRDRVGRRVRRLSRRTVIPEAGILVAATGDGLLVLDGSEHPPEPGVAVRPEHGGATVIALARREAPSRGGYAVRTA